MYFWNLFSNIPSLLPPHVERKWKYKFASNKRLICFRIFRVPLSRDFSIALETPSHLVVVIIVTGSIFAFHGTPLLRTRDYRYPLEQTRAKMCVRKRSEVHYRELERGEYITRRIWLGYVPDLVIYNLTRCSSTPTIVSESKKRLHSRL